jgi:LysM repeat protein
MLIKRLIPYFIAVGLMLPAFAFSQTAEIKEYKVKKGDTLWDISSKELQDPFLWPKIWKENPEISNPDLIYPGQSIKIPLYLLQRFAKDEPMPVAEEAFKPVKEEAKSEPAPVKITPPLVDRSIYMTSGFLGNIYTFSGTIDGHFSERTLYGNNDIVYVKLAGDAVPGDRFYIYHPFREVRHPVTGEKMGFIIEPVGILEITKIEHGQVLGKIVQSFTEIHAGYLLNPYFEMKPPVIEQPFRRPDIDGYVVAARKIQIWSVTSDIVYLDRGSIDGLKPGDLIGTLSPGGLYGRPYNVPNGLLQVISTEEKTATALVVKINETTPDRLIVPGNQLIKAE